MEIAWTSKKLVLITVGVLCGIVVLFFILLIGKRYNDQYSQGITNSYGQSYETTKKK